MWYLCQGCMRIYMNPIHTVYNLDNSLNSPCLLLVWRQAGFLSRIYYKVINNRHKLLKWGYPWCYSIHAEICWKTYGRVFSRLIHLINSNITFYPAVLKGSGVLSYPERAGGRAAGQTSPVNTLTSIIFHGSFSNLARIFITLRYRTSSIMEVLPHWICA